MKNVKFRLNKIQKIHNSTQILDRVSFSVYEGEILGIAGLNDSGVEELSAVLMGRRRKSGGQIFLDGAEVQYGTTGEARSLGIHGIHRSASLVPELSVLDNLGVIKAFQWRNFFVRKNAVKRRAMQLAEEYGVPLRLEKKAYRLNEFEQTAAEIYKALLEETKVLIFFEAGEDCTPEELSVFYRFLRKIRERGVCVLFIHSNVKKLVEISDRILVMRHGYIADELQKQEISGNAVLRRMALSIKPEDRKDRFLKEKSAETKKKTVSGNVITVYQGKTVGLSRETIHTPQPLRIEYKGKEYLWREGKGNGQTGAFSLSSDTVCCYEKCFWENNIFYHLTSGENIMLRAYHKYHNKWGKLDRRLLRFAMLEYCRMYGIDREQMKRYPVEVTPRLRKELVMLGWVIAPPKILVLNDPFFAADEEVVTLLHKYLGILKTQGTAILCYSNNRTELEAVADIMIEIKTDH